MSYSLALQGFFTLAWPAVEDPVLATLPQLSLGHKARVSQVLKEAESLVDLTNIGLVELFVEGGALWN